MMKKLVYLIFILFLFLPFKTFASNNYWIKTLGTNEYELLNGGALKKARDGNYILLGTSYTNVFLTKFDETGTIIFNKSIDYNNENVEGVDVIETSDGGYLIAIKSEVGGVDDVLSLIKLDSNLQISWAKTIPGAFFNLKLLEDNYNYVTAGVFCNGEEDCDGFILKINKSDNSIDMKTYGESGNIEGFLGIDLSNDGNYIVVAPSNVSFNGNGEPTYSEIWVLKIDSRNGDILWEYKYGQGLPKVIKKSQDGYVIGANIVSYGQEVILLIKLDFNGNIIWARTYSMINEEIMDLVVDNNNIVVTGISKSSNNSNGVIIKISGNDGRVNFYSIIDSGNSGDEADSITIADNGYMIAGMYGSSNGDIFIMKIGADGSINDSNCIIYSFTDNFSASDVTINTASKQSTMGSVEISLTDINNDISISDYSFFRVTTMSCN